WALAAMPTTTRPARAASRPSSASGSSGTATKAATRRGSRSSSTSRPSTTRAAATPHSAASAPTSTRNVFRTEDRQERLIQQRQQEQPNPLVSTEPGQVQLRRAAAVSLDPSLRGKALAPNAARRTLQRRDRQKVVPSAALPPARTLADVSQRLSLARTR